MEEDLVDTHHNVIQTMQNWVQEDSQLISMTQEVDYDQDGNYCILDFPMIWKTL